jgi:hypothetical protein
MCDQTKIRVALVHMHRHSSPSSPFLSEAAQPQEERESNNHQHSLHSYNLIHWCWVRLQRRTRRRTNMAVGTLRSLKSHRPYIEESFNSFLDGVDDWSVRQWVILIAAALFLCCCILPMCCAPRRRRGYSYVPTNGVSRSVYIEEPPSQSCGRNLLWGLCCFECCCRDSRDVDCCELGCGLLCFELFCPRR